MKNNNLIHDLSKTFAVRIVRLSQFLQDKHHEYVLSRQILKSGTSIGANVRESRNAQSKADFINKLNIALKESDETDYWLELLLLTGYLNQELYDSLVSDNKYITAVLTNIIKSCKDTNENNKEE